MERNKIEIKPRDKENERNYSDLLSRFRDSLAEQLGGQELVEKLRQSNEQYAQNPENFQKILEEQAIDFLAEKVGGKKLSERLRKDREDFEKGLK